MNSLIAQPYAQALFEHAKELKQAEKVYNDLLNLRELIDQSVDLSRFFANASIPKDIRRQTLDKVFNGKLTETTLKFLLFLEYKNRLGILKDVCTEFEKVYMNDITTIRVKIASSTQLDKKQIETLSKQLNKKFEKDIQTEISVDPALLGGLKFQVHDTVYDYTLKAQLDKIKEQFIHA
ncbi:MAG: ATP synthase F1 subunit delta [Candidatus Omnitrophica bacterium]|nr:ATP synthase F1 subunit delta [Candidatus Omnitrophota bacterium]